MFDANHGVAVKVCGVTNLDDARLTAKLGAEMIGLNFSPRSPRCISLERAAEMVAAVKSRFVGVFLDQEIDFVRRAADALRLAAVQLHGDESPDYVRELRGLSVIKAIRVGPSFSVEAAAAYDCDAILLDGWDERRDGGSGTTFDWSIAAEARPRVERLILAGGLTPENVAEAIKIVRPDAVDVCSGVEDAPGRKSPEGLRRFLEAAR